MNKALKPLLLISALAALASALPALEAPDLAGPVNDLAGVIDAATKQELASYLTAVSGQTGVQVGVLTVPSLEGDAIEAFSMRVAEKWKLGQKDKDNGAILVVSVADRALRIEVGYGLEAELTDLKCGLIIRNVIAPAFRSGDYSKGISDGARNIVGIATGNAEIVAEAVRNPQEGSDGAAAGPAVIFFVIFVLIMLSGLGKRKSGIGPFVAGSILGSALKHGSGWNDHSGGGFGGFGGGGGGGFSGGGGGFGGGGASGGW